jgi:hypothetical protein
MDDQLHRLLVEQGFNERITWGVLSRAQRYEREALRKGALLGFIGDLAAASLLMIVIFG